MIFRQEQSRGMTIPVDAWRNMGAAGSLGFTLVASTFVGLAAGYFLDNWLDTSPWFTVIFLIFGIVAGFFNMIHYGLTHKDKSQ